MFKQIRKTAESAGHIFEWTALKKAQFVLFISGSLSIYLVSIAIVLSFFDIPEQHRLQNIDQAFVACVLYSLICFTLVYCRRFIKGTVFAEKSYTFISLLIYASGNILLIYFLGVYSIIGGIAITGGPIVGLLLFDKKEVVIAFSLSIAVSLCLFVLAQTGHIEYAALIPADQQEYKNFSWLVITSLLIGPQIGSLVYIAVVSVDRWKDREDTVLKLSQLDGLTETLNRRTFIEHFKVALRRPEQRNNDISLLMIDLDHFKAINDEYGHHMGDEAIILATKVMKKNIRSTDSVARYGGEEFCILLPDANKEVAINTAERIRMNIQEAVDESGEHPFPLTASIGVTTCPAAQRLDISNGDMLKTADEALYLAKNEGRNRTSFKAVAL